MTDGWAGHIPSFDTGPLTDDDGQTLLSPDTDGGAAQPLGPGVRRQIMAGIANGDFFLTPNSPDAEVTDENPLPYWTTVKSAGTEIRLTSQASTTSASNRVVRFDIGAVSANDETYIEQIVPVSGSKARTYSYRPTVTVQSLSVDAGAATDGSVTVAAQFLLVDGVTTTGAETTVSATFATLGAGSNVSAGDLPVPLDGYWLRLRFKVKAAAGTLRGSMTFAETRCVQWPDRLVVTDDTDPATFSAFNVRQSNGVATLTAGSGSAISMQSGQIVVTPSQTRDLYLVPEDATLDTATLVTLGASPNLTRAVAYADAATQGAHWTFGIPAIADNVTAVSVTPIWVPGATDGVAHTVRWSYIAKIVQAGVTITAAGTTTTWTGSSAARTINVVVFDTATSTTITGTVGSLFVLEIRRIGADAADTYVGVVNLIGARVTFGGTI